MGFFTLRKFVSCRYSGIERGFELTGRLHRYSGENTFGERA